MNSPHSQLSNDMLNGCVGTKEKNSLQSDANIGYNMLGDIGNKKQELVPGTNVSWLELVQGGEQKTIRQ